MTENKPSIHRGFETCYFGISGQLNIPDSNLLVEMEVRKNLLSVLMHIADAGTSRMAVLTGRHFGFTDCGGLLQSPEHQSYMNMSTQNKFAVCLSSAFAVGMLGMIRLLSNFTRRGPHGPLSTWAKYEIYITRTLVATCNLKLSFSLV